MKSYAFHNWESYYKHVFQTIVSEESGIPTSYYAAFEGEGEGFKFKSFKFESVISDIRNFIHVFQKKTHWYRQEQNKQQSSQQSEQSTYSSPSIARMLNLRSEELEQLEGSISMHLGELKKIFVFDNHTIESLPKMVEKLLSDLEQGKKIEFTKIFNNKEGVIAYPTEIGLPFLIKYDVPVFMNVKGYLKAKSQPQLISSDKFSIPEKVDMESELKITLSSKQQLKFGFFAPFNHQQYYAGRDDDVQVYLPIKTKVSVDIKNHKFHYEIEPLETERNIDIFQFTTTPYITKQDILDFDASAEKKNVHVIRKHNPYQWEKVFGDRSVGMAFRFKVDSDEKSPSVEEMIKNFYELNTLYHHFTVQYVSELSHNKKMSADVFYKQQQQKDCEEKEGKEMISKLSNLPSHQDQRTSEIVKYASAGIQNARVQVFDTKVYFSGEKSAEYIFTMTYARNQEDSKSRFLTYVKKHTSLSRPFAAALSMKFDMARVNGLDVDYVMNHNLQSTVYIDGAFSENLPTDNQFEIKAQLKRSNARKEYLMEQPIYQRCQSEVQQGNTQLLACANVTQMAGLLDSLYIKMKYPKMSSKDFYTVLNAYNAFVPRSYQFEIEHKQHNHKQGEMSADVQFSTDLEKVNISISTKDSLAYMKNMEIKPWARPIVVVHPIFNVVDRVAGKLYGLKTYKRK